MNPIFRQVGNCMRNAGNLQKLSNEIMPKIDSHTIGQASQRINAIITRQASIASPNANSMLFHESVRSCRIISNVWMVQQLNK